MNNDTKQTSNNQPSGGLGLPPLPQAPILVDVTASPPPPPAPSPTPEPVVPSPLPTLPEVPAPTPAPSMPIPTAPPPAPETGEKLAKVEKPKRKINKKVVIGGVLALFLLVGAAAVSYLFPGFRGDIRQRAYEIECYRDAECDPGFYCSNGRCRRSVTPTPTKTPTPTIATGGCSVGETRCYASQRQVCTAPNTWTSVGSTCTPTPTPTKTPTPTPTAAVGGGPAPTIAPSDRDGVWGEFGYDCDAVKGTCTGDKVNVYSCDPNKTQTGSGGGPICLEGLQTTSGTVDCVALANQTCSFIQLDVITDNPYSGSAMTCYPTIDCTAPTAGPSPTPTISLPPPQTTPGDNPEVIQVVTTTLVATPTGTVPPTAPACINTRLFISGSTTAATQEQMNAIKIGDTIRMVVQGNSASLVGAKFVVRINGNDVSNGGFEVTNYLSPIQASGVKEFYYDYPITVGGSYGIEGYVNSIAPTVTATPVPTATATVTATPTVTPTITVGGVYGNGADGACTATASVNLNTGSCSGRSTADAVNDRVTTSVVSGATSVTLASAPAGIAIGDEILIINLQGPGSGVGDYETAYVTGVSENTLTLNKALTKNFDGTTSKIMVQRVPHYTTVTVNGTMTADTFSCSSFLGGVLFFRANGAVNVASAGAIDMGGKGFAGGGSIDQNGGIQGVSQIGCGTNIAAANDGGGGGGRSNAWDVDPGNGAGGGGGGNGTGGGGGGNSAGGNQGGAGGTTYGVADLTTKLLMGAGGGGGGNEMNGPSGDGGGGGGIVAIYGDSITVAGKISSGGGNATTAYNDAGGGGGGAGGSILLYGKTLTLGTNLVTASGGAGSAGGPAYGGAGGRGGNGGVGRISIRYETGSAGTTTPAANSAQITMNERWLLNKLAWDNIFDRR